MADMPPDLTSEALAAAGLGVLGAIARITAVRDPLPVFRKGFFFRIIGEGSLGLGCWLLAHAVDLEGFWALACAWAGGVLGYAVVHDALLRMLNQRTGGGNG